MTPSSRAPFDNVGYVKGMARLCTLQACLLAIQQLDVDLMWVAPALMDGPVVISCRFGLCGFDIVAIAFENARLSNRGAIRKSHCAITWVVKLNMCSEQTKTGAPQLIKQWNTVCTRDGALTGGKRVAVLALLEVPTEQFRH